MREAAKEFEFEKAAKLRDRVKALREKEAGFIPAATDEASGQPGEN
jgi:excinuclease UvrABC nuclease subunit